MADEKQYSEAEHIAILADRVTRETADITAERDRVTAERDDLATKLDVAESAKVAAEKAKEEAEQKLAEFQAEVEKREAAAQRAESRVATIKEKAPHLDDKWFEAPGRMDRIVAMEEDAFPGYVDDLVAAVPAGDGAPSRDIPRETAMHGKPIGDQPKTGAGRAFLMRDYEKAEV